MNKHIINVLNRYNFTYDNNHGYGFINGYEVNVLNYPSSVGPMFFISSFLTQTQKNNFVLRINDLKIKLLSAQPFEFGVEVVIGAMTGKSFETKANDVLSKVFGILNDLDAPKSDICPQSGEAINPIESRNITIDGLKFRLSINAIDTINSNVKKSNEDYNNSPNNYLKGLAGIVLGAVVGVILTIVLWYIGFVTTIAPLVSIILGTSLYKRFGGKQNWVMIVMSFVVTLVFILSAFVVVYAVGAQLAVNEAGYSYKLFEALKFCLDNIPEFRKEFYVDLALNAFFIVLAEGFSIFTLLRSIKRPTSV